MVFLQELLAWRRQLANLLEFSTDKVHDRSIGFRRTTFYPRPRNNHLKPIGKVHFWFYIRMIGPTLLWWLFPPHYYPPKLTLIYWVRGIHVHFQLKCSRVIIEDRQCWSQFCFVFKFPILNASRYLCTMSVFSIVYHELYYGCDKLCSWKCYWSSH